MSARKNEKLTEAAIRYVYSFVLLMVLPLLLLLFRKKLKMKHVEGPKRSFMERFGKVPDSFVKNSVLFHCVSIGELNAASGLIKVIQAKHPEKTITISTSSTTGAEHAYALFANTVQHVFLPIDIPWFMSRFLKSLSPSLVLVTEVEIWPNMLAQCAQRNIPTCLINARLSEASLPTYRRLRWLLRPALKKFDLVCAQSQQAFDNFRQLGVYKSQMRLTLNMKFDLELNPSDTEKAAWLSRVLASQQGIYLLGASTHESEESLMLNVYQALKQAHPGMTLILVPRHPHRFDEVYLQIKASGLSLTRLSHVKSDKTLSAPTDVVLVDMMGQLKACYSICDVAFIGGSFVPKGGHNALECALYGKPMVMGESIFNNPYIVSMLASKQALKLVANESECISAFRDLLADPHAARKRGQKGLEVLNQNRGAVQRTYTEISAYLKWF
ncbi:3-deoxy-D-manno-octulosonic acid transferase [Ningiella sp. W23]|uniref:3-deoxy-D-manno-octulosonic acid transferase n=1 Tax=Ningiella sp. W23 TaxID=3023715 RepID=UPI00375708C5